MIRFDEQFIKTCIPDVIFFHKKISPDPIFSVDSRGVKPGEIFVALSGARTDGHDFVEQAVRNGASGLIIQSDRKECLASIPSADLSRLAIIIVSNTLQALISLAMAWRSQFSYPVVGITGSFGKTSTKETLSAILHNAGKNFLASYGNQNTQIGASLNILKMRPHHEIAIFEMGISRSGEMANLAKLIRPTVAVITSIGHCHMEGLGSLQNISVEKRDIFKYFTEENIGIIHGDQPLLTQVSYQHPVIKFGLKTTNQLQARKVIAGVDTQFTLKLYKEKYPVRIPRGHTGLINNALAAAAVAHVLGIEHAVIIDAIQKPLVVSGRFELKHLKTGKGTLINDCYNANPESMKAALLAFEQIKTSACKIAVIGDMLELGANSPFWHRQIGRFLRRAPSVKRVILVGALVEWTKKTVPIDRNVILVPTWKEAVAMLQEMADDQESVVLVKGSNGVGLVNLVNQCT